MQKFSSRVTKFTEPDKTMGLDMQDTLCFINIPKMTHRYISMGCKHQKKTANLESGKA